MALLQGVMRDLGNTLDSMGGYTAQAADRANSVSQASQSAQGAFNQRSADNANALNQSNLAAQYNYNAAQAASANQFTSDMWDKAADFNKKAWMATAMENQRQWQQSADFNKEMWQKEADYNSAEAQKNREFQQKMSDTQITRAAKDMKRAGLNPILAIQNGAGIPGGSTASVGGSSISGIGISPTSMGSAQGIAAQGGLLGSNTASESNFTGQMEYMSGMLGIGSALINSLSSALDASDALGSYGSLGEKVGKGISDIFFDPLDEDVKEIGGKLYQKASNALEKGIDKVKSWMNGNNKKNDQRRSNDKRFH